MNANEIERLYGTARHLEHNSTTLEEELAIAIVELAIKDYRAAIRDDNRRLKYDCERFFKGEWAKVLTDVDLTKITPTLKEQVAEFIKNAHKQKEELIKNGKEQSTYKCPICGSENASIKHRIDKDGFNHYKNYCGDCDFYYDTDRGELSPSQIARQKYFY